MLTNKIRTHFLERLAALEHMADDVQSALELLTIDEPRAKEKAVADLRKALARVRESEHLPG